MGIAITHFRKRTASYEITITDDAGAPVVLVSDDKVRIKIGRENSEPLIDIVSGTPTPNGTSCTGTNPSTLVVDQSDVADMPPGIYEIEAIVIDAEEDGRLNKAKHAESGIFQLIGTQTGSL